MPTISVRQLYLDNAKKLDLAWVVGASKAGNDISHSDQHPTLALVGHVNLIHPNRIQVFGQAEVQYLDTLSLESARIMLDQLFSLSMSAVIVANDVTMPQLLRTSCAHRTVPLLGCGINLDSADGDFSAADSEIVMRACAHEFDDCHAYAPMLVMV